MSTNKTYFYLQLKDDFFDEPEIKILQSQKNGSDYIILWQKLLHLSIKGKPVGSVLFNGNIPYDDEMLSSVVNLNIDIVRVGVKLFERLGMIEIKESGEIWIEQAQEMVSITSSEALRKKKSRLENKKKLMISGGGWTNDHPVSENRPPEYRDKSLKNKENTYTSLSDFSNPSALIPIGSISLKQDCLVANDNSIDIINDIINHYNSVFNKITRRTKDKEKLIKTRLKEGWTADDIKLAITNMSLDTWEGRKDHNDLVYAIGKVRGIDNLEKWLNNTKPQASLPKGFFND